ncbi:ATP-binding protein [Streptomyces sp. TRM64462]|uniref:ATP-binding protein n=1 Tax=Streptomyces sp. TRM64462 TaxID=2741726 RepID=UPI001586AC64|nr:ATP-binding protein [Streptomyces sp. TRM64462]
MITTADDRAAQGKGRLWLLPHGPKSAGIARRVARAALHGWGVASDAAVEPVLLVVSELVTNAVEHALPPVALRLEEADAGTVHLEVQDGGPSRTKGTWIAGCDEDEHGRGILIVDRIATAHGSRSGGHGTTVWADLPLTA